MMVHVKVWHLQRVGWAASQPTKPPCRKRVAPHPVDNDARFAINTYAHANTALPVHQLAHALTPIKNA